MNDTQIFEQSAVIPFRRTPEGLKILLITSRRGTRWVIPKGLVDPGFTPLESAVKEAWEEAGIRGSVRPDSVGEYRYRKWGGQCRVQVYLMEVERIYQSWPETGFRRREWLSPDEAARRVDEPELKQMIQMLPAQLLGD